MGELLAGRVGVDLEVADGGHDEAGHAEGALETLLVDDALLDGMEGAVGFSEAFDGDDLLAAGGMGEDGAGVMGHVVDEDGAGAAFGAVAAEFGAGEAEFIAQGVGEGFLLHDVYAALLAIDVEGDEALDRSGGGGLSAHAVGAEHVARAGDGSGGDDAFEEIAPGEGAVFVIDVCHDLLPVACWVNAENYISFWGRCHLGFWWVRGFGSFLRFSEAGAELEGLAPVAVLEGFGFVPGSGDGWASVGCFGDGGVEDLGGDSFGPVVLGFGPGYGVDEVGFVRGLGVEFVGVGVLEGLGEALALGVEGELFGVETVLEGVGGGAAFAFGGAGSVRFLAVSLGGSDEFGGGHG